MSADRDELSGIVGAATAAMVFLALGQRAGLETRLAEIESRLARVRALVAEQHGIQPCS